MTKKNIEYFKNLTAEEIYPPLRENPGNSVVKVNEEKEIKDGKVIAIKDIHVSSTFPVTAASGTLQNFQSPFDSHVVSQLKSNGYVIACQTNMDEFAMGGQSIGSYYGPIDSAINDENLAGGSSGGSAYLVGKGLIPIATGTDTGGSVRQPAALNNVYGFKGTYGLISRYGTITFASSFDTIGLFANDIHDLQSLFKILSVKDGRDQTAYVPENFHEKEMKKPKKKVAFIKEWENVDIHDSLKTGIKEVKEYLLANDYEINYVSIPEVMHSVELYTVLAYAEAASNLSRYDGIRFGSTDGTNDEFLQARRLFGKEVEKRLIIGSYMLASENSKKYYQHAQKIRTKMIENFKEILEENDFIMGPMVLSGKIPKNISHVDYASSLEDSFAIAANLVGVPSISVPLGLEEDIPKSIQIIGNHYEDKAVLKMAELLGGEFNE